MRSETRDEKDMTAVEESVVVWSTVGAMVARLGGLGLVVSKVREECW